MVCGNLKPDILLIDNRNKKNVSVICVVVRNSKNVFLTENNE